MYLVMTTTSDSLTRKSCFDGIAKRSERFLICAVVSSAETYKTTSGCVACFVSTSVMSAVVSAAAICVSSVDLPMPGSPEMSTSDPVTRPPPRTRSNSRVPVEMRSWSSAETSDKSCGLPLPPTQFLFLACDAEPISRVPNAPQLGHDSAQFGPTDLLHVLHVKTIASAGAATSAGKSAGSKIGAAMTSTEGAAVTSRAPLSGAAGAVASVICRRDQKGVCSE